MPYRNSGSIHRTVPATEWPSDLWFYRIAKIVGQEVHPSTQILQRLSSIYISPSKTLAW
jgi:hypothetical protein